MAFTIKQNIMSITSARYGISNMPGVDKDKDPCLTYNFIVNNLNALHYHCVNPILDAFGTDDIYIKSAYRSMALNNVIGGNPKSGHVRGHSIDIVSLNYGNSILWNWCFQNLPNYHQLIWEYPERGDYKGSNEDSSWVHISYIEGNFPRTSSVSSKREDIHEMYKGEKTLRKGNYTHNITIAEQSIIDSNYEPLRNVSQLRSFQPPDENNG